MAELRSLRTFAAVARHRSFSRAADDLFVTQQAASRTVARLEAELGIRLLTRGPRGVEPTPAGEMLLAEAERLLVEVDVALDRVREVGRGRSGLLRLGATPAVAETELARLVAGLRAQAPELAVSVDRVRPRRVAPELLGDQLDVVVARTIQPGPEIELREIGESRVQLAVPARHRLAREPGPATLADLDGERLVVWSDASPYTRLLVSLAAQAGARVEPVHARTVGIEAPLDVAEGAGVALIPAPVLPLPGVVVREVEPPVTLPLVAAWRRWAARPAVERFLASVRAR